MLHGGFLVVWATPRRSAAPAALHAADKLAYILLLALLAVPNGILINPLAFQQPPSRDWEVDYRRTIVVCTCIIAVALPLSCVALGVVFGEYFCRALDRNGKKFAQAEGGQQG